MDRYRTTGPRDNPSQPAGDSEFLGVYMVAPDKIPAGYVAEASNTVFDQRVPETRPGKRLLPWLNQLVDGQFRPWRHLYGFAPFRDPNRNEWVLVAADGHVYRARENNSIIALTLPVGCRISGPVNFIQAFNVMLLQQGERLPNLVLIDIGEGFELAVPDWNPLTAYAEDTVVAYGTEVPVASVTVAGGLVTVVTTARHEYQTLDRVFLYWETRAELRSAFQITVVDDLTFTFDLPSAATALAPAAITSITSAALLATVTTTAPHGLVTGRRVVISGAVETEYNGEYAITKTGASTFTYTFAGSATSPATGTKTLLPVVYASRQTEFFKVKAGGTAAGESPGTTPSKYDAWTDFQAPWTLGGISMQARVFYPFGKDYVAASETLLYNDLVAQKNEFRINQGDSDQLVALAVFNKRAFIGFKEGSIYLLANVYGDLTNITQERIPAAYGCLAPLSIATVGADLWFLSQDGVRSLYATTQNEVLGRDQRVSMPIDPLIARLNDQLANGACAAFCNGKYYLGAPLDSGRSYGPVWNYSSDGETIVTPLNVNVQAGQRYLFTRHAGDTAQLFNGATELNAGEEFVAAGSVVKIRSASGEAVYDFDLKAVYIGNNAILTYNTKTEAWEGVHEGAGVGPVEFRALTLNKKQRLFYAGLDGFIYLWGEGRQDQVPTRLPYHANDAAVTVQDIPMRVKSRGYDYQVAGLKRFTHSRVALATWNPSYSLSASFEGVNDELELTPAPVTKSRTAYFDPWDRPAFDASNMHDDHGEPGREDYSIALAEGAPLLIGSGINFQRDQESEQVDRISHGRRDRVAQLTIENTQGYLRVNEIELTGEAGDRTAGVHQ